MINDNTILSSFNDRPTLLEWLKKVEEALKSDTAKSISVDNPETNVYIIKITFADGRVMYTEPIRLPDSVNGVSILNNHLVITMQSGLTDDLGVINPYADTIVSNSETNTTEIGNNAVVDGNLQVNSNIACTGEISGSHINVQSGIIDNDLDVYGVLSVDGDLSLGSNIEVQGTSELQGSVHTLNNLKVDGNFIVFNNRTIPHVPSDYYSKTYLLMCKNGTFQWFSTASEPIPPLPNDAYMHTYVLKAVNGTLTWVLEK